MRLRVIQTDSEENWDFELPEMAAEFLTLVTEKLNRLEETKFFGFAHVGPAIEIRRISDSERMWFPNLNPGEDESECELGCTCIMCIPGA